MRSNHIGPEEWKLRRELADCYRLFADLGWGEAIFNHITVRVPGPERHFLINPFGLMYEEVAAETLVKIDIDGNAIGPSEHPVNPAGFIIHAAIHAAREDAHCVMHVHTTAGVAVSCKKSGLSHDNVYGAMFHDRVSYHDFEGITVHAGEQPRLVRALGDRQVLILRNHGLLVVGADIPDTFRWMWTLQRACEVQCQTQAIAGADIAVPEEVQRRSTRDATDFADGTTSRLLFDAMVRRMRTRRANA